MRVLSLCCSYRSWCRRSARPVLLPGQRACEKGCVLSTQGHESSILPSYFRRIGEIGDLELSGAASGTPHVFSEFGPSPTEAHLVQRSHSVVFEPASL
jgi:hypothetical protein